MSRPTSTNLVFIGAAYQLQDNDFEQKIELINSILATDCLPMETSFVPRNGDNFRARTKNYWEILKAIVSQCRCYLLLITKEHLSYKASFEETLTEELEYVLKNTDKPIIILHFNSLECKRFVDNIVEAFSSKDKRITRENYGEGHLKSQAKKSLSKLLSPPKKGGVHFQGFYYSPIFGEVKDYRIEITPSEIKQYKQGEALEACERGFHDQHKDTPYEGITYVESGYLHLDLDRVGAQKGTLNIRVNVGASAGLNDVVQNQNIYFGTIEGITSIGRAKDFCYETVLLFRGKKDTDITADERKQIERFLYLNRKGFTSEKGKRLLQGIKNLELEGGQPLNDLESMVGTYRIWTLGRRGQEDVTQSIMTIDPNYRGVVFNPVFGAKKEQVCEVSLCDGAGSRKIYLLMRAKDGNGGAIHMTSVAITEVPSSEDPQELIIGAFCSAGQLPSKRNTKNSTSRPHDTEVRGGFFVARLEEPDNPNLKAKFLKISEIKKEQDASLGFLLDQLWKENGKGRRDEEDK